MSMSREDIQRLEDAYQADAYQPRRKPAIDPVNVAAWCGVMAIVLLTGALLIAIGIRITDWLGTP